MRIKAKIRGKPKILYTGQDRQNAFHDDIAPFRLFGGAASGGKSHAMMFEAIKKLSKWKGCHGILLRRTFPELEMTFIRKWQTLVPKKLYKYHKTSKLITWKATGSTLQFGHCTQDDDVFRYLGTEFDFIGIDEVTQFSEFQIKYLISRLRTNGIDNAWQPSFFCAGNPGGKSHSFIKRLFIDNKLTENELASKWTPESFSFIPSFHYDNKYTNDTYVQNLGLLDDVQRKQLLDGNWDIVADKFFEIFSVPLHVVPAFPIPQHWKKIRCIDYGRTNPFACLWIAISEEGDFYVYREYYKAGEDCTPNSEAVVKLSGEEKYMWTVCDTAVFAQHGHGESLGQVMSKAGLHCIPADKDRESGWALIKNLMRPRLTSDLTVKPPQLRIFYGCDNLITEMTDIQPDRTNKEDCDTKQPDHACDALRYGCKTLRHYISKPSVNDKPSELENKFNKTNGN